MFGRSAREAFALRITQSGLAGLVTLPTPVVTVHFALVATRWRRSWDDGVRWSHVERRMEHRMISTIVTVILMAFGIAVLPAQTQRELSGSSGSGGTRIVSPTVVATWATRGNAGTGAGSDRKRGPQTLGLLVLWRGTPGWFSKGTSRSRSSGGSATTFATTVRQGDLELDLSVDYQSRRARVQGKEVTLGDANVILVDRVDGAEGPQVVKMLSIDAQVTETPLRLESVLKRSPEIVSFLQCDAKLPDPKMQPMVDTICAGVIGK